METEFALSLGSQRWTLPAGSDTITLGRASNADVRLPSDDQISRIHARLNRTGDTWTLYDESRNGTGLNGRRLAAPTPLTNNDQIHIGRSVLTFHSTQADAPAVTPPLDALSTSNPPPAAPPPYAAPTDPSPYAEPPDVESESAWSSGPAEDGGWREPADEPFEPADPGPFGPGDYGVPPERDALETSAPPAPPDLPPRMDAPSNFPLFEDERADTPNLAAQILPPQQTWSEPANQHRGEDDEEVGTVRLPRVLIVAGAVIVLGLVINLIISFVADGPSGALRWLVPPAVALITAMIVALLDAAGPSNRAPGRFDVSIVIAIVVVLAGVGVGGFALTAGVEYVGGYLTGNESGQDRLIKPVARTGAGFTVTVENITDTGHFTRVEVKLTNTGHQAASLPLTNTATLAAGSTPLRADPSRSDWPGKLAPKATAHGTITFKGGLPSTAKTATLTLNSTLAVPGLALTDS